MKFNWKKIFVFIGIITVGVIGLMVADQFDFLSGRKGPETGIGTGTAAAIDGPFQLKKDLK